MTHQFVAEPPFWCPDLGADPESHLTPDTRKDQYILSTPYELEVRSDQEIYKYTIKKSPRGLEEVFLDLSYNKRINSKKLSRSIGQSFNAYANNDLIDRMSGTTSWSSQVS